MVTTLPDSDDTKPKRVFSVVYACIFSRRGLSTVLLNSSGTISPDFLMCLRFRYWRRYSSDSLKTYRMSRATRYMFRAVLHAYFI
jgi:hypothetical protein